MRRTLLLLAAAFALTACKVEASVDVSMKPDGSGAITLTVVADAELVSKAPNLAADLRFEDATAAGWVLDGPTPTDTGGLQVVLTHDFDTVEEATALLRSLNGSSGPLQSVTITRSVTEKEVIKGGAYSYPVRQARASYNGFEPIGNTCNDIGFRCVKDAKPVR